MNSETNRRDFLNATSAAAAVAAAGLPIQFAAAKETETVTDKVHVYDEFGELKEVIIGSPLALK